jgi:hypothetical protein
LPGAKPEIGEHRLPDTPTMPWAVGNYEGQVNWVQPFMREKGMEGFLFSEDDVNPKEE